MQSTGRQPDQLHLETIGDAKDTPTSVFSSTTATPSTPAHSTLSPCTASVRVLKHAAACNLLWGSFPSPLKSLVYALHKPEIVQVDVLLFWRKGVWWGEKGNFPPRKTQIWDGFLEKWCEETWSNLQTPRQEQAQRSPKDKTREGDDRDEATPLSKHSELGTQKQGRDTAP